MSATSGPPTPETLAAFDRVYLAFVRGETWPEPRVLRRDGKRARGPWGFCNCGACQEMRREEARRARGLP